MRKKRIFLLGFLLLLIFIAPILLAAENDTEQSKVDLAYNCLNAKITDKCDTLSYEEKIFSLLATGKCKDELLADEVNNECFPKSGCKIKTTAQSILALNKAGESTTNEEAWLLSQNKTPTDLNWYLEIDSSEATICSITYSGNQYAVSIGEDRKISGSAGCLSLAEGGYWLEISQKCYNNEFDISCNKPFITSLLFKKKDSSKIYVSADSNSASAEGTTTEKINSYCFTQSNSCDYEGSLWAALVLDYLGYDVSSYMPYLVTMTEGNLRYLPESFLYILTGDTDYRTQLLAEQSLNYWDVSGDKFYDTALALYSFQYEDSTEKTNSMNWLLNVQDKQGCWQGNIRDTAFILYSVWPKISGSEGNIETSDDCELNAGGYCMSSANCEDAGGSELYSYSASCSGLNICCDSEETLETCDEMNGVVCPSGQACSTSTTGAFDTSECCLGYCSEISTVTECENYGGACRSSCFDGEEETSDSCDYSDVCCVQKTTPEPATKSYWWIWVLLILIVLVLTAIIFRDKLRHYWFRFFHSKPKGPPPRRPLMPFGMPPRTQRRLVPRRPLPSSSETPLRRTPPQKPQKKSSPELDDVLKKLKDIGK